MYVLFVLLSRMMDPVVTYYGKGMLSGFPVDPSGVIDVVRFYILLIAFFLKDRILYIIQVLRVHTATMLLILPSLLSASQV